ncbi:MAG: T9SS type A sorting domain-containing protein, partial [Bacteroidota bacterium]
YDDKGSNPTFDCTGDGKAYGSSGFRMKTKQCTDRRYDRQQYSECELANVHYFHIFRTHYLKPAGMTIDSAMQYDQYAKNPLGNIVADGVGVDGGMTVCPMTKEFMNETISMDSTYLAADSIVTDNMVEINSGVAVTFNAGELVRLKPGFIANNGATFTAKIGGCVPNFNQELEQRLVPEIVDVSWRIYPNPLRDHATIEYTIRETMPIHIYVLDLNGKLVKTLLMNNLQREGRYLQTVDFSQLHTGLYFVVFQSDLGLESRKISVVK